MATVIIGGHELPAAVGRDDCYLAAILEELVAQREQVAALEWGVTVIARLLAGREAAVVNNGPVELREPEAPAEPAPRSLLDRITGR